MLIKSNVKLHEGQEQARKAMLNNPVKYNIIKSSRQAGKTAFIEVMLSYFAINSKVKCLWASPTISQARKVYREIKKAIPKEITKKTLDGTREIWLINGTYIEFIGVEKPDNIRGDNTDIFILDEFAFYKSTVWPILRPFMITKPNAVCIIISTPRGMEGNFFNMYNNGLEENGMYRSYTWNYKDNPYCDLREIDAARLSIPDAMFRQEYLGEFVKGGASVFNNVQLCSTVTEFEKYNPKVHYYNGNDIAKQKDFTVATTMNERCQVSNIMRMRRQNYEIITDALVNQLKMYKPRLALMEVNGVGDATFDFVRNKFKGNLIPWTSNNSAKELIVSRLVNGFNTRRIGIPTKELSPTLHQQLETFTFTYSAKTRKILYHAIEGYHDDDVISLALANEAWYTFHGRTA